MIFPQKYQHFRKCPVPRPDCLLPVPQTVPCSPCC